MYVIIGANGYLGSYIVQSLLSQTDSQILCIVRNLQTPFAQDERLGVYKLDITDWEAVERFARQHATTPIKMIMLATIHNPDEVAADFQRAWHTNITSLSFLINCFSNIEALYYASTDSVYGQSADGYHFRETDRVSPANPYGHQKAAAEQVVIHFGGHVVRYPFLIGKSLLAHKQHFYDKIVSSLSSGTPVEMLCDSYRSSLDFYTAAGLLVKLMQLEQSQVPEIVNVSGDDDISKYDVGLMIADQIGAPRELIVPVTLAQSRIYATPRASSTLMDNALLKRLLHLQALQLRL